MKTSTLFVSALLIVAGAVVLGGEASGAALEDNCRVATIHYDEQRIAVWCFGEPAIHYAHGTSWPARCAPRVSVETIKVWVSLLQSSLLSGRPVDLYYTDNTTCTAGFTTRVLEAIRLQNR